MNKLFVYALLIPVLFACNSGGPKTEATAEGTDEAAAEAGIYGETISGENAISGSELIALLEESDSVWVTMESVVVSNCQTSGCWMDLDVGSGEVVKVTFKDYGFFIPLDSKGKTAIVEGFAKREVIPVDILKHYAEDDGKSQEEIDAITEPQMAYTFEAIGVIIKG